MSACTFVMAAVHERDPLRDDKSKESVREDVGIIESSLQFVNDLFRNMPDMHRASNDQLKVHLNPTDTLHDVLEPVDTMLYRRGSPFRVIVDCPASTVDMADRLRLKQVVLNLGRNSSKFVGKDGFIRLRASVVDDFVQQDSGPGIPVDKRERMFMKFQESLDSLSQGTVC